MIDCPHCLRLNSGVDMVAHSKAELAAALHAAAGMRPEPAKRTHLLDDARKIEDEFQVVIEWHRPSGVTTYRLRPAKRMYGFRVNEDEAREAKYALMSKKAKALKPCLCL